MSPVRLAGSALAAVLLWSAVAKLRDAEGTAAAFQGLGLRAAGWLAVIVPMAEMATAVLLVVTPPVGGAFALFLFVAFTVVIGDVLRRGVRVRCACFGGIRQTVVGPRDLVRNAALIVVAMFVTLG